MNRSLERLVWNRAGRCCEYCRIPQVHDFLPFQIDHIISVQHGGDTIAENLCLACFRCNHHKGPNLAGWDFPTSRIVPLFHPRQDRWLTHFRFTGGIIMGKSAKGRVTAHVLSMNFPSRVLIRQILNDRGIEM